MNKKEEKLLRALLDAGTMTLGMMGRLWRDKRGASWARNCLRKLVRMKLAGKVSRGIYRIRPAGEKYIQGLDTKSPNGKYTEQRAPKKKAAPASKRPLKKGSIAERILTALENNGAQTDFALASRLGAPQPSIRRARKSLGAKIVMDDMGLGAGHQTKWARA